MEGAARKEIFHWWKMVLLWLSLLLYVSLVGSVVQLTNRTSNQSRIQEFLDRQTEIADTLLKSYDKRFMPTEPGKPLKIDLEIVIADVFKLDDREMEIEMIIYVRQRWYDYRLSWNDTKKFKIREHFMDKIWLPDFRIINLKDMKMFEGFGGINMNIYPDGKVYLSQLVLAKTSCPMDLHNFPMDRQLCFLNFSSFAYGRSLIAFELGKEVIVKSVNLPQFEFIEVKEFKQRSSTAVITIELKFQRRAVYYIIQIYIPSTFLVILSWLAFFMKSSEIADRFALEIALILSIVFLHGGTNTSLPAVSYAKASDWFVIVSFGFIFLALLETMLVYRLSLMQHKQISERDDLMAMELKMVDQNSRSQEELTLENQERSVNKAKPAKSWSLASSIDKISVVTFPLSFVGFNIFYWWYYLIEHKHVE